MSGTRKSTRISAKSSTRVPDSHSAPSGTNEPEGVDSDQSDHHLSEGDVLDELPLVRTRKRKAVGGVPRTRKKGKLSSILTLMPNEVIGEICSHLQPSDLLHLVQSSKIFAIFLLAKSSGSIWRYTRLSIEGLPSCPSDITEQQYTCLLFGHYCQASL
ncbi:hypothetical protein DL93DRAFT_268927 [Clavulina sp. PMI_390]|nr:hypothetical protein DL93DRAFT_268927 [Clavulina sp. PMI_390]